MEALSPEDIGIDAACMLFEKSEFECQQSSLAQLAAHALPQFVRNVLIEDKREQLMDDVQERVTDNIFQNPTAQSIQKMRQTVYKRDHSGHRIHGGTVFEIGKTQKK